MEGAGQNSSTTRLEPSLASSGENYILINHVNVESIESSTDKRAVSLTTHNKNSSVQTKVNKQIPVVKLQLANFDASLRRRESDLLVSNQVGSNQQPNSFESVKQRRNSEEIASPEKSRYEHFEHRDFCEGEISGDVLSRDACNSQEASSNMISRSINKVRRNIENRTKVPRSLNSRAKVINAGFCQALNETKQNRVRKHSKHFNATSYLVENYNTVPARPDDREYIKLLELARQDEIIHQQKLHMQHDT